MIRPAQTALRRLVPALAAGLVLALGPAAASAAAKPEELRETTATLNLRGSHGYAISIEGFAVDGAPSEVSLTVRGAHETEAEYSVPATVSTQRLEANFGRFGRVSVRFTGGPPHRRSRNKGCNLERESTRRGSFAGTIRFRGEEGFTTVSASRARGSVVRTIDALCPHAKPAPPRRGRAPLSAPDEDTLHTTVIEAGRKEPDGGTGFFYISSNGVFNGEPERGAVGLASAETFERRGRIEIERRGTFEMPARSLAVEEPAAGVQAAMLAPPSPLAGSAEYSKEADEPAIWSGDLRVSLPGAESLSLAGPGFESLLCQGEEDSKAFERCSAKAGAIYIHALER
jgi:hypothetical protein